MPFLLILRSFFVLLLFQALGTALQALLRLPIPGPVLGMALLAAWLLLRRGNADSESEFALRKTSNGLLAWLGLLFVPAGVGVFTYLPLLRASWLPIAVALTGSTLLTLAATALVMKRLGKLA